MRTLRALLSSSLAPVASSWWYFSFSSSASTYNGAAARGISAIHCRWGRHAGAHDH